MKIAVFGLGYVGAVTAACFAKEGHLVIGVDINKHKVDAINKGHSPIIEKGLGELICKCVKNKRFSAATSATEAVLKTDIGMVCVGTPSMESGAINIEHLKIAVREIGEALNGLGRFYTIVIRSTALPGTIEDILTPILEQSSGRKSGRDFGICANPEFMREGNSLEDFYKPAKTIIGTAGKKEKEILEKLYSFTKTTLIATDIKTAEFSKYLDNTFHGLKISFANEMAGMAKKMGVEPIKAMEIFCKDRISNISPRYLKPGFSFGGSCLPKDIRAVLYKARTEDIDIPLIGSILESNDIQIDDAARMILKTGKRKIGLLGLSFKPGTDDLRESQLVRLAEILIGKGLKLRIYDKNVSMAKLVGTNKAYINKEIPYISSLLCRTIDEAVKGSEVIVIGHGLKEFRDAAKKYYKGRIIIDLCIHRAEQGSAAASVCCSRKACFA
ncbi:MAG: GDP-mannose dehydrogenase [Candidatus Omnitrophica bacterium CG12_big_fil_rev_8_21_14_0_65_42_8]|nr:MAG: GDP-mannose dehydrogenase [Candidatus Omnitrophica bacterium CG12_big_fil_rev_8_21_14_0_65_42_8]